MPPRARCCRPSCICCPRPAPTASRPAPARCRPEPSVARPGARPCRAAGPRLSGLIPAILCSASPSSLSGCSASSQIGGQTGDTLGALQQGGEIVVLLSPPPFFIDSLQEIFRPCLSNPSTNLRAACLDLPAGDDAAAAAVARRQDTLTKPQGSLGRLETLVAWLARWQGRDMPRLDKVKVMVFAGSHGVTAQGVSAFPAEVTAQMVANFAAGGAAINQLARVAGAELDGDSARSRAADRRFHASAGNGRGGIPRRGGDRLRRGRRRTPTCSASARWASATPRRRRRSRRRCSAARPPAGSGRGTGVDDAGLQRKIAAIDTGLALHEPRSAIR